MGSDATVNLDHQSKLALLRDYTRTIADRISALRARDDGSAANELLTDAFQELDVTREELTVADEELQSAEARYEAVLRDLEARVRHYAELFDGSPDGYVLTDPVGIIRECNRTLAAMLCVHKRFLDGKPLVNFISRADVRAYRASLTTLLRSEGDGEMRTLHLRPRHDEPIFVAEVVPRVVRGVGDRVTSIRWTVRRTPASRTP